MTNKLDEEAFVREMAHADLMREQSKTVTFAGGQTYEIPYNTYTDPNKDDSND